MKTQEKSYTLISQNVAFNMSLRDEIDTHRRLFSLPTKSFAKILCNNF